VIVVLALFTLVGTICTAMAPTLLEFVKGKAGKKPGTAPTSGSVTDSPKPTTSNGMVQAANDGLSLVEAMVLDYRAQRDNAQRLYGEALEDLEDARETIREQAVRIAELQGGRRRRTSHYGDRYAEGYADDRQPWDQR
jgi:hypothetical protein